MDQIMEEQDQEIEIELDEPIGDVEMERMVGYARGWDEESARDLPSLFDDPTE